MFEQAKHWFGDGGTLTLPFDDPVRLERLQSRSTVYVDNTAATSLTEEAA